MISVGALYFTYSAISEASLFHDKLFVVWSLPETYFIVETFESLVLPEYVFLHGANKHIKALFKGTRGKAPRSIS